MHTCEGFGGQRLYAGVTGDGGHGCISDEGDSGLGIRFPIKDD